MAGPLKPKKPGNTGSKEEIEDYGTSRVEGSVTEPLKSRRRVEEGKEKGESETRKRRGKDGATSSNLGSEAAPAPTSAQRSRESLHSSSSVEMDSVMVDATSSGSTAVSPRSPVETFASGGSPLVRVPSGGPALPAPGSPSATRVDAVSPRAHSPTLSSSRRPKHGKRLQISTLTTDSQESTSSSPSPHHESNKLLSSALPSPHSPENGLHGISSDDDAYDDRSTWLARVQLDNPVIHDVRQRVRPFARTLALSRTFHVKPDYPVQDLLTGAIPPVKRSLNELAIGLSMQHLHAVGFTKSVGAIHLELDQLAMRSFDAYDEDSHSSDSLEDEFDSDSASAKPITKRIRKAVKTLADFGRESSFPGGRSSNKDFINTSFHKDQAFFERDCRESPLVTVLRSAMRRSQNIYDLAVADRSSIASLSESQLEELLSSLGLLEDDYDTMDDVDIWAEGRDPEEDLNAPRPTSSRLSSNRHSRAESLSQHIASSQTSHTPGNSTPNSASSPTPLSAHNTPPGTNPSSPTNPSNPLNAARTTPNTTSTNNSVSSSSNTVGGDYSSIGSQVSSQTSATNPRTSSTSSRNGARTGSDTFTTASTASPLATGASTPNTTKPKDSPTGPGNSELLSVPKMEGNTNSGSSPHTPSPVPLPPRKASGTPIPSSSSPSASAMGAGAVTQDSIKGRKLIYDMWADVEDEEERPIRAATLNKLVEVATSSKLSDLNFLPTFLLTYKSFTTPKRLFEKLRQRFNVPMSLAEKQGLPLEQFREFIALPIRLRVISFLKRWLQDYPEDIDRALLTEMRKFVDKLSQTEPNLKLVASSIGAALDKISLHLASQNAAGPSLYNTVSVMGGHGFSFQALMHGFSPYASASALVLTQSQSLGSSSFSGRSNQLMSNRKVTIPPGTPPVPKVPKMIFHPSLSLYQIDQEEFARQLTIMDSHVFISIKPSELLNQSWNKPKFKHLAPNVLKMVNMFNQLSHAISAQILQGSKPKDRAKIIEWWIKVAEHCKHLSNYHGLMAVVSGINSGPTVRLKASRREVSKSLLDQLASYEAIFESDGSFSAYRSTLLSSAPPLIPYLGIHLTDLTFIEEGNRDMQAHLINFAKRRLLYQTISALQNFQQTGYNLQSVRQIQDIIANLKAGEVRDLFKLSLMREPRERS